MLLTTTTLLSQRADPAPLWIRVFPKRGIGRGITSIFRVQCDKAKRGCASHVPPPRPARRCATREGCWWRERPPLFGRWCATGEGKGGQASGHPLPPLRGGRSLHSDPCGKAEMNTWTQLLLIISALAAVALRMWLFPWPASGEVALLDLVRATDPFMCSLCAGGAELEQGLRGMGQGGRRRGDGRSAHRPDAAPLSHRQDPEQQLPDAGASGLALGRGREAPPGGREVTVGPAALRRVLGGTPAASVWCVLSDQ